MALVAGRLAGTSPPGGAQRLVAKRLFMRSWLKCGPGLLVPVLLASSVVAGCLPRIDGTASCFSFAQVLSLEHTRFFGRMQGRLDLLGRDACLILAGPGEDGERGCLRHLCKVSPDDSRTLPSSGALLRGRSQIFRAAPPGVDRPPVVMISMASRAGFRGSAIPTACLYSMAFFPVDLGDGSTLGREASWCAKDCFLAGSFHCV